MLLGAALATLGHPAQAAADISPRAIDNISRYCATCWRNARLPADRWDDCTQEVFCRLLNRLKPAEWQHAISGEGDERREFLRAIDAVKKRTQRERRRSPLAEDAVADSNDLRNRNRQESRDAVAQAARSLLSERQQEIVRMTCDGWSVSEIGDALSLNPQRVSDEKYKAVQKLRQYFDKD